MTGMVIDLFAGAGGASLGIEQARRNQGQRIPRCRMPAGTDRAGEGRTEMTDNENHLNEDPAAPVAATRRRRVVRVELPDELHALATLTGRDPEELVKDMLTAQVASIRSRAAHLLGEAV